MPQRPGLTAAWRNLLLLNFPVPTEVIARIAPPGTEPDLHDGQSYISIVGFCFEKVHLFGIPFPGHTSFPEINLRYYVRREVAGEVRRGVVFAREIVPRRAVAILANRLYNESYVTRRMRTSNQLAGQELAPGDTISYSWKTDRRPLRFSSTHDNHLTATVAVPLALPTQNSLEESIVEHYWGYTHTRTGSTNEYRVAHVPWRIASAIDVVWQCDVAANYTAPLAKFLTAPPTSAIIAEGSPIGVFRGSRLT
jgi:uncharacterized protein YqjF (DUF2071 family)